MTESARAEAERWLAAEPDADIRAELEALLAGPADEVHRALRRPAAVRHRRIARRRRRRSAADEQARRPSGRGRSREVPARHRPACTRAGRDHRLRRPPQERSVRARHRVRDGRRSASGRCCSSSPFRRPCWRGRSPRSAPPPASSSPRPTTRRPTTATRCTSATVPRSCHRTTPASRHAIDEVDPVGVDLGAARSPPHRVGRIRR